MIGSSSHEAKKQGGCGSGDGVHDPALWVRQGRPVFSLTTCWISNNAYRTRPKPAGNLLSYKILQVPLCALGLFLQAVLGFAGAGNDAPILHPSPLFPVFPVSIPPNGVPGFTPRLRLPLSSAPPWFSTLPHRPYPHASARFRYSIYLHLYPRQYSS